MNTGWLCPRCSVVHAPSVLRCECGAASRANDEDYFEWVREQKFRQAQEAGIPGRRDPVGELTLRLQVAFAGPKLKSGPDRSRWLVEHADEIAELAKQYRAGDVGK